MKSRNEVQRGKKVVETVKSRVITENKHKGDFHVVLAFKMLYRIPKSVALHVSF